VPQRLVLVETGPEGFAPSTAYRVEHALRRAGIRAAVEVVQAGSDLSDYHGDALAVARRLSLRAVRTTEAHETDPSSLFADPPSPRPVTTTRRRATTGAHADRRATADHSAVRWQPRAPEEVTAPESEPEPVDTYVDQARHEPVRVVDAEPFDDSVRPIHPDIAAVAPVEPVPLDVVAESMPVVDAVPSAEPTATPSMVAGQAPLGGTDPAAEADLSNRERELLRQLHEELAKREQAEPQAEQGWQPDRQEHQDRQPEPPGTEFDPADFRQPEFNPNEFGGPAWHQAQGMDSSLAADQTAVNGIPPYGGSAG
jgi:hypothetical protein